MIVHETSLLASEILTGYCSRETRTKIRNMHTLLWQGEIPSHRELRSKIEQYFNTGMIHWDPKQKCWLVMIPFASFIWRDRCLFELGLVPPGEGTRWFGIRIFPAETYLTIATYDRNKTIEDHACGLAQFLVETQQAAIIQD